MPRDKRRSNLVMIRGGRPAIVTQKLLDELLTARLAQWAMTKRAAQLSEEILVCIQHGASIEAGALAFDCQLECVQF